MVYTLIAGTKTLKKCNIKSIKTFTVTHITFLEFFLYSYKL